MADVDLRNRADTAMLEEEAEVCDEGASECEYESDFKHVVQELQGAGHGTLQALESAPPLMCLTVSGRIVGWLPDWHP